MHLRRTKQLYDMKLKIDNANAHQHTQADGLEVVEQELQMQMQELRTHI